MSRIAALNSADVSQSFSMHRGSRNKMEDDKEKKSKPRIRSDAQLARKRSVDRLHHQAKRVKEKNQLDNIEDGTTQIQQSIQKLADEVRRLNLMIRAPPGLQNSFGSPSQSPSVSGTDAYASVSELENSEDQRSDFGSMLVHNLAHRMAPEASHHVPQTLSSMLVDGINSIQDAGADWARADYVRVACRCDLPERLLVDHESSCFELATYTLLLRAHRGLSTGEDIVKNLPRSPSIANMLLLQNDNPIATTLNYVFKSGPAMKSLPITMAAYFVMFLFLRWRACPDTEAFENLPPWLYPTPVQTSIPHPLCIDYLPWPAMRDYLTQNQGKDPRQTVKLYLRSTVFRWPESRTFLARGPDNEVVLHPDFVSAAYKLENWQVTRAWADEFPSLVPLVNVQGGLGT